MKCGIWTHPATGEQVRVWLDGRSVLFAETDDAPGLRQYVQGTIEWYLDCYGDDTTVSSFKEGVVCPVTADQ